MLFLTLFILACTAKTDTIAIRQKQRTSAAADLSFRFLSCLIYIYLPSFSIVCDVKFNTANYL